MKILYIGRATPESTSRHRANALGRLGHNVSLADPYAALSSRLGPRLSGTLHYRTGYRLLQTKLRKWVAGLLQQYSDSPDLLWIDNGELLGRRAIEMLRQFRCPLVLYNLDDPTGHRDGRRWDSLLSALPAYDLCVVVRSDNISEFVQLRVGAVHRVWRSYDEVEHRPFDDLAQIPASFRSDVAFVGTWIRAEERDRFMLGLVERGLNIAIWGNRWEKSTCWRELRSYWRGPALSGRDYVAAIQGAKVTLGLLSHANRDLHTQRSAEVPYAGGLLCAERTSEHLEMYRDGEEAMLWKDADECAAVCWQLLADDGLRKRIRTQGMARVRQGGYGNEVVCSSILSKVFSADILVTRRSNQ